MRLYVKLAVIPTLLPLLACAQTDSTAPSGAPGPIWADNAGAAGSSIVLHPIAQGNWISFSANGCSGPFGHWDCVNDQPANEPFGTPATDDGDATALTVNGRRGWKDSYRLDGTQLPGGAIITGIVITARAAELKAGGPDPFIRLFFDRTGLGANVNCPSGGSQVGGTTYQTVSCTFDGLNLSALPEIGIEETTGRDLKVTQVYAAVFYQ